LGSGRANTIGYSELPPHQTASELLGHLKEGDKVAITTRRRNNNKNGNDTTTTTTLQKYVTAMTNRGLQVRVIEGQSGVQDFCFLRKAQRGLAGNAVSTFVAWAALLGNARTVQLYIYDTPGLRKSVTNDDDDEASKKGDDRTTKLQDILGFQWDHPKLKHRVRFPVYNMKTMSPSATTTS
jgi:hypothetical protein